MIYLGKNAKPYSYIVCVLRDYGILNKHLLREWLQGKEPGYKYDGRAVFYPKKRLRWKYYTLFAHRELIYPLFMLQSRLSEHEQSTQQIAGGHFNIFTSFFLL